MPPPINEIIYCESEVNEFCQKLLFDNGCGWWQNKDKEIIDCRGITNFNYVIFHIDKDNGVSVETGDKIKGKYFREVFKNEIRELKLKRICTEKNYQNT